MHRAVLASLRPARLRPLFGDRLHELRLFGTEELETLRRGERLLAHDLRTEGITL